MMISLGLLDCGAVDNYWNGNIKRRRRRRRHKNSKRANTGEQSRQRQQQHTQQHQKRHTHARNLTDTQNSNSHMRAGRTQTTEGKWEWRRQRVEEFVCWIVCCCDAADEHEKTRAARVFFGYKFNKTTTTTSNTKDFVCYVFSMMVVLMLMFHAAIHSQRSKCFCLRSPLSLLISNSPLSCFCLKVCRRRKRDEHTRVHRVRRTYVLLRNVNELGCVQFFGERRTVRW